MNSNFIRKPELKNAAEKLLLLLILLVLLSIRSIAQVAPSQDAINSTININPSDLYKGYTSETVPLHNITIANGFTVPINLIYQTKGIKVEDEASSVGLGWGLMAGGSITRLMMDEPDDQSIFQEEATAENVRASEVDHTKGYDFEKDIFYMSYPGGSSRFIYTGTTMGIPASARGNETIQTFAGLPLNDLKIEFEYISEQESYWIVTDLQGVKYIFGETTASREITHSYKYENQDDPLPNEDWTFVSTWHLSRIEFPGLSDAHDVHFTYALNSEETVNEQKIFTMRYNKVKEATYYGYFDNLAYSWGNYRWLKKDDQIPLKERTSSVDQWPEDGSRYHYTLMSDYRSSSLYSTPCGQDADGNYYDCVNKFGGHNFGGNVERFFSWGNWIRRVDEIKLSWYHLVPDNSYTEETITNTIETRSAHLLSIHNISSEIYFSYSNRVDISAGKALTSLIVSDKAKHVKTYSFEYDYFDARRSDLDCAGSTNCLRLKLIGLKYNGSSFRSFEYIDSNNSDLNLPAKNSFEKDIHGYFKKGADTKYHRQSVRVHPKGHPLYDDNSPLVGGANKLESEDAQANSLKAVNYPGGRKRVFSYTKSNQGGNLLHSIIDMDNDKVQTSKTFSFVPDFTVKTSVAWATQDKVFIVSRPSRLPFDVNDRFGFKNVTVTDHILGQEFSYIFNTWKESNSPIPNSEEASKATAKTLILSGGNLTEEENDFVHSPAYTNNYVNPSVGLLRAATVKDSNDKPISTESHFYDFPPVPFEGRTFGTTIEEEENRAKHFTVTSYSYDLTPLYLSKSITKSFNDSGELVSTQRITNTYHNQWRSLIAETKSEAIRYEGEGETREEVLVSGGDTYNSKKYIYYPCDYSKMQYFLDDEYGYNSAVLDRMVDDHIVGVPVATRTDVELPEYANQENSYSSYRVAKLNFTLFKESAYGIKPLKSYRYNFPKTYIYRSVGFYQVVDPGPDLLSTLTYNDQGLLASKTDQSGITAYYTYDPQGYLTSTIIDPGVESMKRTTTYTHYPLIGIKSTTGPDGRKTTYEYDQQNRLLLTRDDEDNIQQRYRYNLAGQANEKLSVSVEPQKYGYNLVGQPIRFNAAVSGADYGESQYIWSDHSSVAHFANYTFNTPGTKDITASVTNIEHPNVEASGAHSIQIYEEKGAPTILGSSTISYCPSQIRLIEEEDFQLEDQNLGSYYLMSFEEGARCLSPGYQLLKFQYSIDGAPPVDFTNLEIGAGGQLPEEIFWYRVGDFMIHITLEYTDKCGGSWTASKWVQVIADCND